MGYKDDLIKARDITASNYRQGKMSPYDDPFNDTYYDQEGWNKELTEAASKDDKIKYEEYLKRQREEREAYYRGMRTEQRVDALEREYENMDINEKIEARKKYLNYFQEKWEKTANKNDRMFYIKY